MLRLDSLNAKQDALDLALQRRDSQLRELFRATLAFRRINSKDAANCSESSFLERNNILEGRSFSAATLPSLTVSSTSDLNESRITDYRSSLTGGLSPKEDTSLQTQRVSPGTKSPAASELEPSKELGPAVALVPNRITYSSRLGGEAGQQEPSDKRLLPVEEYEEAQGAQLNASEQPLKTPPRLDPSTTFDLPVDASTSKSPIERGKGLDLATVLPVSSDDVGGLPESASEAIVAEQTPGNACTIQLSSKDVQEHRIHEEAKASASGDAATGRLPEEKEDFRAVKDHSELDTLGVDVSPAKGEVESSKSLQVDRDSVLQSQMKIARADAAYTGIPATPDEQLRLEQEQALQLSRIPSAVSNVCEDTIEDSTSVHKLAALDGLGKSDEGQAINTSTSFNATSGQDKVIDEEPDARQTAEAPTPGIRESVFPGISGALSGDITLSRRPPMRIDTTVAPANDPLKTLPSRRTTTPGATSFSPPESATGTKPDVVPSQVHSPPERMTTRVSSGALRHKSVSEILGETPRHSNAHSDKASSEKATQDTPREESVTQTPRSAFSITSPDTAAFRQRLNELKDKDRSKLSTVVFARQQNPTFQQAGDPNHAQHEDVRELSSAPLDYLLPLFTAQASMPASSQALHSLVVSAHKTLTTTDHYIDTQEQQDCRILTKIYHLQSQNRWSLRQSERSVEPGRPKAHWDVLISQMKWMRTDFREERKWKLAAARSLASACALWVASEPEQRSFLQVRTRPVQHEEGNHSIADQAPDLIPSSEDDSDATDFEAPDIEFSKRGAPASLFSLPPDMFVFGLHKTPVAEKILSELPLYQPSVQIQDIVLNQSQDDIDDDWKTQIVPVSKFVQGKMVIREEGPPRKRSRFDYPSDPLLVQTSTEIERDTNGPEPEKDDVALFRPENKHIRDRIHAGHAFRPPSEFLMPSQSFFESRQSSQWTQAEDDELRRLVREYAYNWSLISSCLSSTSLFSSGAERRTPWECFERWITLEGLPGEMSKTQYFKTYSSRLQAAQRNYEAHQQALQQHQGNNGQIPLRRRTTLPILVERRKNSKHLHLVDAMRKLAKKRETAIHKQQHVAGLAAMRKQNEAVQPRAAMHTPQEFSRVKFEREQKVAENQRLYQQQIMQQREKARNQRPGGPGNGQNMMSRGPNYPPTANGSSPNVTSAMPNNHASAGPASQMRSAPSIARLPNGTQLPSSLPSNSQGVPHAPMQPQMQMQPRVPAPMMSDNARIFQEANRLQEQQRRYLAAQTQHQHPQSNGQVGSSTSPPNMTQINTLNQNNAALQTNASIYGGLQGRSGSPPVNGAPTGSGSSPRMGNPSQPQPLSSGMVPVINQMQNQIKARNPQASPEQVKAMTTESLHQYRMNQAAMQAAAGNPNATGMPNHSGLNGLPSQTQQQAMMNGINGSPMMNSARAQYAAMVHSQQAQQSRVSGGGMGAPRPASRSATPQTHPGHAPSQSPRPSQAQMAGGQ